MPPKSKTPPQAQPGAAESAGSCPPSGQLAILPKLSAIYGACRTGAKTLKNLKSRSLCLCWNMKKPYIRARMERVESGGAAFCNTIRAGVVSTWDNWMLRFVKVLTRAGKLSKIWTTRSSSTGVQNSDPGQPIGRCTVVARCDSGTSATNCRIGGVA